MAISIIKPRHANEGRSIAAVLKDRIDFDKNPDKTKGGLLVSSYQCSADTAWQEFALSKQIYEAETGRKRDPEKDVISYLIIQSFKPGEISPEDANKLGYQLALEFTGGQHQFLVATHVDKRHIHCHIEFNSTTLDCTHKFNNYRNTYQTIRKINDRLCREHGLSVIEKPKEKGKHYAEWANGKRGTSWKDKLRRTIDRVLPAVSSYEEFLAAMRQEGYEIQTTRKALSFRLASEGQERFTRAKTLGADYTPEAIKERIGQPVKRPRRRVTPLQKNGRVNLLLDIQSRLQGRGPGYERWLKIHNLKEAAKTLNYLTEHNITEYDLLAARAVSVSENFEKTATAIKQYEHRMEQIAELKKHIIMNIFGVGMSPFIMNVCACCIVIFINNRLLTYGGDLSIGAFGILNRIQMLFVMIVMGITMGMQPISGYNYGARHYDRVKQTLRLGIIAGCTITTVGFLISELFPSIFVGMFTTNHELTEQATLALRIGVMAFPIIGAQIVITQYFQSIGKVSISILLSLSRQLVFLLPGLALLPPHFGVEGVWFSMPLSDTLAFIMAALMLIYHFRKLKARQQLND